jgi:hypothetical protein
MGDSSSLRIRRDEFDEGISGSSCGTTLCHWVIVTGRLEEW